MHVIEKFFQSRNVAVHVALLKKILSLLSSMIRNAFVNCSSINFHNTYEGNYSTKLNIILKIILKYTN